MCSISLPPDPLIICPTSPTPFCFASTACHMITPLNFLNHNFTCQTPLRVFVHPFKRLRIRWCQLGTQERLMLFTCKWVSFSATLKTSLKIAGTAYEEGRQVWKVSRNNRRIYLHLSQSVQQNRLYLHNIGSLGPIPMLSLREVYHIYRG